jgi:hypothetical protein
MKHKHAELIKAWADGAHIQRLEKIGMWNDLTIETSIDWEPHAEYRIKPEEKQPVVRWLWAFFTQSQGTWGISITFYTEREAKQVLGAYRYIKLEYTRQEFPE